MELGVFDRFNDDRGASNNSNFHEEQLLMSANPINALILGLPG